ncbi:hypothetical protein HPB52_009471 [Rhipicephalus sanguineus]|uniref:DNA-directed RNA polymerase III subunit RPC5 n=1 Tax=Rhipicephalus sanguineus TaxID=34632 RepID=A0A9D4PL01_RHISA|nr:hypothetical protein HPB52_009471 [Rhipicephalus sanguineus]
MTNQVMHIEPPVKAEADQFKRMESAATPDPATDIMIEPGTSDGAGHSIKAEPGSSKSVCQPAKAEPSASSPTSHMSAKIKTEPQDTGAIRPCPRVTTSSRDTYTMTSTIPITCPENYAMGLLLPGELHLTPLHAIVHMVPMHCRHQEGQSSGRADANATPPPVPRSGGRGSTAKKGPQASDNDSTTLSDSSIDEETSSDKRCKRFRQERSTQVQPEDDSEPWLEATVHNCYSEMSLFERELLVGPRDQEPDLQQFMSGDEQYLERLLTKDPTTRHPDDTRALIDAMPQGFPWQGLSMHVIGQLPLEDRITAILKNAKVVQFAKLMSLLPDTIKEETAIDVLHYVAVLVQGCWVVKSEELYPRRGFSEKTGVRSETLSKARDLLLYMYTETRHVKRSTFAETLTQGLCAFPAEDIKALLGDISRPTPDGWEFLLPYDADFANAHPDVVLKQQEEWDKRRDALSRTFRPSVMARLQKRRVSQGESSSTDGGGNATYRSRTTPKPGLSSRRSSSGSPATKLSKKTN